MRLSQHRIKLIVAIILFAILYEWKRRIQLHRKQAAPIRGVPENAKKGPVIAFGACGLLYAFYCGVGDFIRQHFDLQASEASITGSSGGTIAAAWTYLDCDVKTQIRICQGLYDNVQNNPLGGVMLSSREVVQALHRYARDNNVTDEKLKQQQQKYGMHSLYFQASVVDLKGMRLRPMQLHSFRSMKELVYAIIVSCRILPFFARPGYWNGRYCIDGALTKSVAISEHDKKREIIKIQLECIDAHDDAVIVGDTQTFTIWDCMDRDVSMKKDLIRWQIGYDVASKRDVVQKMMEKGLKLKPEYIAKFECESEWNEHVKHMKANLDQSCEELLKQS